MPSAHKRGRVPRRARPIPEGTGATESTTHPGARVPLRASLVRARHCSRALHRATASPAWSTSTGSAAACGPSSPHSRLVPLAAGSTPTSATAAPPRRPVMHAAGLTTRLAPAGDAPGVRERATPVHRGATQRRRANGSAQRGRPRPRRLRHAACSPPALSSGKGSVSPARTKKMTSARAPRSPFPIFVGRF